MMRTGSRAEWLPPEDRALHPQIRCHLRRRESQKRIMGAENGRVHEQDSDEHSCLMLTLQSTSIFNFNSHIQVSI